MASAGLGPRLGRQIAGRILLAALLLALAAAASASPARAAGPYVLEIATDFEGTGFGAVTCKYTEGVAVVVEECEELEFETKKSVTLTAVPEEGSKFIGFTNGEGSASICKGLTKPCTFTLGENSYVEARFDEIIYTLDLKTIGEGEILCEGTECEPGYPFGTELALEPLAEEGYELVEWGGDCAGFEPTELCILEMYENHNVTATFKPILYPLTITYLGAGTGTVKCKVNGGSATTCASAYPYGKELTLIAIQGSNSEFVEWGEDCSFFETEPCELTMEEPYIVTATFKPTFGTLTITKAGTGSGEVKCKVNGDSATTCAASYPNGTSLELLATASAGSEFTGFSSGTGSASGCSTSPCSFKIGANSSVAANFKLNSLVTLAIAKAGTGTGTVTSSSGGINCGGTCSASYAVGSKVTLTATAASGSIFAGWSGACSGTGACKVTMSAAQEVTATFNSGTVGIGAVAKVKAGKALLKLACRGGGPCAGSLKLTAKINGKKLVIGKGSFRLAANASTTLKVKLSGPAKTALAKGALKAKVTGTGVTNSSVKLKPAAR